MATEIDVSSPSDAISPSVSLNKLSSTWSLWVMSQHGKVSKDHWQANQTKVMEVSTVEDFWRMFNHIHPPSKISSADYSLFRDGITPAWEDKVCQRGGRWVAKSDKCRGVDEAWQNVVLSLIGEQFTSLSGSNCICGSVVSTRRSGVKIALWIGTRDRNEIMAIGKLFKDSVQPLFQGKSEDSTIAFDFFGEPSTDGRPIEM